MARAVAEQEHSRAAQETPPAGLIDRYGAALYGAFAVTFGEDHSDLLLDAKIASGAIRREFLRRALRQAAVTILPGATLRVIVKAVYDFARDLRERGPTAEVDFNERFKSHALGNLHRFAGFDQVRAWEGAYLPAEERGKYADSVGHQPGTS